MGSGLDGFFKLAFASILLLPLGMWKVIEIVIWIYNHVSINIE